MEDFFQKLWVKVMKVNKNIARIRKGLLLQSLLCFKPTHTTSLRFVSPLPERSYADSTISWRATLLVLRYAKLLCGQHSYAESGLADSFILFVEGG